MIKILLIIALLGFYWNYEHQEKTVTVDFDSTVAPHEQPTTAITTPLYSNYECDGRTLCSQMNSYEEAKFFLDNCPDNRMDGDHDGIPCEKQF
ncbi:MAG: excalibur calcium-binding domain-containing protein [Methylococcales bacterium]|nr:excalibur calcium-binding domain-containing protein [Methylococcales bacterium]